MKTHDGGGAPLWGRRAKRVFCAAIFSGGSFEVVQHQGQIRYKPLNAFLNYSICNDVIYISKSGLITHPVI